jgi:ATP-dependent DNA helicase RecG
MEEEKMDSLSQFDPRLSMEFLENADEDQRFDRKRVNISLNDLATHIVGFANADGGVLVIGQTNDKKFQGISLAGQDKINSIMKVPIDLCVPPVLARTEEIPITNTNGEEDRLLFLHVDQSERIHTTTNDEVYYRKGDSTKLLRGEARRALEYDKGNRQFENEEIPECTINELDISVFEKYKDITGYSGTIENLLTNRGLAINKNGNLILRVSGVLLFAKDPSLFLPQATIRFIRYEGMKANTGTRSNVIKEQTIVGPLVTQIEKAKEIIKSQLRDFIVLGQQGIFETSPEYPEFAWQEAVVNAVTHRAYNLGGLDIIIKMYDDRLEFESPGRLPGMVRLYNIKELRYSRNPRIAIMLSEFKYVRRWGEGIDRIFEEMELFHLNPPEFLETDQTFILTLRNNIEIRRLRRENSIASNIGEKEWFDLSPEQRQALEFASIRNKVFTKDFADFIGRSRVTAKNILESLVEEGYLERYGTKPTDPRLHYKLNIKQD